MSRDPGGAGRLVHLGHGHGDVVAGVHRDHRHLGRQVTQPVGGRLVGRDDDHTVDRLRAQPLHALLHRPAVERAEASDADVVAGVPGGLLDAVEGGGGAVERGVDADHAEHARTAGDELAGGLVGPVVELAHGGQHPGPGLGADEVGRIEHPRDGHRGDSGEYGDVHEHRRPAGFGFHRGSPPQR